jgi:hypothetical protein
MQDVSVKPKIPFYSSLSGLLQTNSFFIQIKTHKPSNAIAFYRGSGFDSGIALQS